MTLIRRFERDYLSPQLTVDGRTRSAQILTLIDTKAIHDYANLYFDEEAIGGASASSHDQGNGGYEMTVSGNGEAVIRQTKQRAKYISGNTQFIEATFDNMVGVANVTKRVGYFSSNQVSPFDSNKDGFWFESNGVDSYRFVISKNGTETEFTRDNWNQDKLDGTGKSGVTIDFTKFNILVIDFLYLGGAGARFGFVLEGRIIWAHIYWHTSIGDGVFVYSPQQPVRYEIRSTGGASTLVAICSRVGSEGESGSTVGITHSLDLEDTSVTLSATATKYAIAGIRLKSDRLDMSIEPLSLELLSSDNNKYFYWQLQIAPTLSGSWGVDWADFDSDSNVQQAKGLTATRPIVTADGEIIASGKGSGRADIQRQLKSALKVGSAIDGTRQELILCVGLTLGSTASLNVTATLDFQDFH